MKVAAGYGLILGFVMIAVNIMVVIFRAPSTPVFIFTYIGGLIYTTVVYREKYLGGIISYGKSLTFGILVSGFAFIILGVIFYMFASFFKEEFIKLFNTVLEEMKSKGYAVPPQEYEYPIFNPLVWILSYLFLGLLAGLTVSAITSVFTKKN